MVDYNYLISYRINHAYQGSYREQQHTFIKLPLEIRGSEISNFLDKIEKKGFSQIYQYLPLLNITGI
jgi:hypothetical protein